MAKKNMKKTARKVKASVRKTTKRVKAKARKTVKRAKAKTVRAKTSKKTVKARKVKTVTAKKTRAVRIKSNANGFAIFLQPVGIAKTSLKRFMALFK
jgi:hypothetical protein